MTTFDHHAVYYSIYVYLRFCTDFTGGVLVEDCLQQQRLHNQHWVTKTSRSSGREEIKYKIWRILFFRSILCLNFVFWTKLSENLILNLPTASESTSFACTLETVWHMLSRLACEETIMFDAELPKYNFTVPPDLVLTSNLRPHCHKCENASSTQSASTSIYLH